MLILPLMYLSIHFPSSQAPSPCPSGHSLILPEDSNSLVIVLPASNLPCSHLLIPPLLHLNTPPAPLCPLIRSKVLEMALGSGFPFLVYFYTTLVFHGSHPHSAESKYTGTKSKNIFFQDNFKGQPYRFWNHCSRKHIPW